MSKRAAEQLDTADPEMVASQPPAKRQRRTYKQIVYEHGEARAQETSFVPIEGNEAKLAELVKWEAPFDAEIDGAKIVAGTVTEDEVDTICRIGNQCVRDVPVTFVKLEGTIPGDRKLEPEPMGFHENAATGSIDVTGFDGGVLSPDYFVRVLGLKAAEPVLKEQ